MLVIFAEEESMKATLEILLPKLGVLTSDVVILSHQGKSDLVKSWRKKLPAWNTPDTRFLILRDADGADCIPLKNALLEVPRSCGKQNASKVRIVCQELEAWFIGDRDALVAAGYNVPRNSRHFDQPDALLKPSHLLKTWKPGRQKIKGAVEIATHMDPDRNTSLSFKHTIATIEELAS